jgi:hypothetical protein
LFIQMSCRIAVNMAKRAAAGAVVTPSVWLENEADSPSYAIDRVPTLARKRVSNDVIALRCDPARSLIMGLSIFVTISFVSYVAYAHQWSELSALRHLGKVSPAIELNASPLPALTGARRSRSDDRGRPGLKFV